MSFFSGWFHNFRSLTVMCLGVPFTAWGFANLRAIRWCVSPNLAKSEPFYLHLSLSAPFSPAFPSGILTTYMLDSFIFSHRLLRLCAFCFNLFSFSSSDWIIFMALSSNLDSYFCHFQSAVKIIWWILHFRICIFSLEFPFKSRFHFPVKISCSRRIFFYLTQIHLYNCFKVLVC